MAANGSNGHHNGDSSHALKVLHPLEPLTPPEIIAVKSIIIRNAMADSAIGEWSAERRFESIELKEPPKAVVRSFQPGDLINREARINVYELGRIGVWRIQVSITEESVQSCEYLPEACPMIQLEEFSEIEETVLACPEFIAACAKRGIEDMSLVCVDPWSGGSWGREDEQGRHVSHTFAWVRSRPDDNLYAHPIEGLCAVVDIKTREVIRVDDHGVVPVPMTEVNYAREFQETIRTDLKPIHVIQPEGVSFRVQGRRIKWHEWSVLVGFNGREGLTLHDISYGGRPVIYRASLAEMVVPYGTPEGAHYRKNVFDIGEYGIGKLANSLSLGCDCLGSIRYMDGYICDINGDPSKIENAICIHEEDSGILWKHWDFRTEKTEIRRGRRLVISSISTVGNYEYGSYWYLYFDGMIEFEMKATGIINTAACLPGQGSVYGSEVAPGVFGHIHQHIFCARLDMAVDGDENSVVECNTHQVPVGPNNPYGNAFYVKESTLDTEASGFRRVNYETSRFWKVENATRRNWVDKPTAYRLAVTNPVKPYFQPFSVSGRRSAFADNQIWVTAYDSEERFAAGEYMNHSQGTQGLPCYVAQDRPIKGADVVLWHVFGLHHPPRPEDFPVQPCISTGFKLMPEGFFDRNPCLDLPYDKDKESKYADSCCENGQAAS